MFDAHEQGDENGHDEAQENVKIKGLAFCQPFLFESLPSECVKAMTNGRGGEGTYGSDTVVLIKVAGAGQATTGINLLDQRLAI
jgi:hypothetical protein